MNNNPCCEREVVSGDQHVRARYKGTCKTIDTLLSSLCTLSLESHSSRTTTAIRYYTTQLTAHTAIYTKYITVGIAKKHEPVHED